MSKIEQEVIDLIVNQLGVNKEEVTPSKSLIEDLNADSLDLTELMMTLEDQYGFQIADEEGEKLKTVSDIIQYIEKNKKD